MWQGNLLDGTVVALKALRIFANSKEDQERVRKVRILYPLVRAHLAYIVKLYVGILQRVHDLDTASPP